MEREIGSGSDEKERGCACTERGGRKDRGVCRSVWKS